MTWLGMPRVRGSFVRASVPPTTIFSSQYQYYYITSCRMMDNSQAGPTTTCCVGCACAVFSHLLHVHVRSPFPFTLRPFPLVFARVRNETVKIDPRRDLLFVKGHVPGQNGGFVRVTDAIK